MAGDAPGMLPDDLDLTDALVMANLFDRAAAANLEAEGRAGSTQWLPGRGAVVVGGDVHDHGLNLMRLVKLASLHKGSDRHVVLQELIHGPHRINGMDLSVRTLARVAALKLRHPRQVHLLLANHELSQWAGDEILKDGAGVVDCYDQGLDYIFGERAPRVRESMRRFIASMLLAVRCPSGILCTHSLPAPRKMDLFDLSVLDRVPTERDLRSGGSAHMLVWGRRHTQEQAEALSEAWDVTQFVMGHQPAEMGYFVEGRSMLVMASDHDHGMALAIDLSRGYRVEDLVERLIPLASVVV